MTSPSLFLFLTLAPMLPVRSQQARAVPGLRAGLVARCTLIDVAPDPLLRDAQGELESQLTAHQAAHGWSWALSEPDMVDPSNAAACPIELLEAVECVHERDDFSSLSAFLIPELSQILLRNGRANAALELVRAAIVDNRAREAGSRGPWSSGSSFLAREGAKLAAKSGKHELALELMGGWRPSYRCGNCGSAESGRRAVFEAECLVALGRRKEALDILEPILVAGWTANSAAVEVWLECTLAERDSPHLESAARLLEAAAPELREQTLRAGIRRHQLSRMDAPAQLANISELAQHRPGLARGLLLDLDIESILPLLEVFDLVDGNLRDEALASVLANLGLPEVGPVLVRAATIQGEGSTSGRMLASWEVQNRRWQLLVESDR